MTYPRRLAAAALSLSLFAAACSSSNDSLTPRDDDPTATTVPGGSGGGNGSGNGIQFVTALQSFDACSDLLSHLQATALERVGPYGLDTHGYWGGPGPIPLAVDEEATAEADFDDAAGGDGAEAFDSAAPSTGEALQEGVDFSGTNVQELGVDEPDLIKTDGERIYLISNNELILVDVTGEAATILDRVNIPNGWGYEMLISGDRIFVIAHGDAVDELTYEVSDIAADIIAPGYWQPLTNVVEIEVTDGGQNLDVTNTLTVEGNYLSARLVDGTARIVVSSQPTELAFVYPQNPAGEDRAEEANREVIRDSSLEDWLPGYILETENGDISTGLLHDCAGVHVPEEFSGFNTLSVLTLDMAEPIDGPDGAAGVLANGENVYASTGSLYVATNSIVSTDTAGIDAEFDALPPADDYRTSIHQFDISDPNQVTYLASGSVEGYLLNQFAMSEHEDHLRVATTIGAPWGWSDESESIVTVLGRDGNELVQVGRVGDMGNGEQIFSVRFVGDIGYVVTFRQTDPFYTVDLSDPTNPVVRGELKITGYSGYLHPIGDNLVVGVGQEATDEGFTTGAKVTVFDVSDLDNPVDVATWVATDAYSDAEWDHRAFLYWAPENLLVMPLSDWSSDFQGAVVLRLDGSDLTEVGRIEHGVATPDVPANTDCEIVSFEDFGISELEEDLPEEFTILRCDGEDSGGLSGHDCDPVPAAEVNEEIAELGGTPIDDDEWLEGCFPIEYYEEWNPISRTLVIGDQLWSLSYQYLQANDLASLDVTDVVAVS